MVWVALRAPPQPLAVAGLLLATLFKKKVFCEKSSCVLSCKRPDTTPASILQQPASCPDTRVMHKSVFDDMLSCMRTTLDIPDEVLANAKRKAIEDKATLTEVVERALRVYVSPGRGRKRSVMKKRVVVKGRRLPHVDISDRDRLFEAMERAGDDRR
jgi:hypothetical protein